MKRRMIVSIILLLSVATVALVGFHSTATAAKMFFTDSGVVTLGPNQILRVTVANGVDPVTVRARSLSYLQTSCDGGPCKHIITSQTVSDPLNLAPGEAASYNLGDTTTHEVRAVVSTNHQNVKILFQIINTTTGGIVSTFTGGTDDGQSI